MMHISDGFIMDILLDITPKIKIHSCQVWELRWPLFRPPLTIHLLGNRSLRKSVNIYAKWGKGVPYRWNTKFSCSVWVIRKNSGMSIKVVLVTVLSPKEQRSHDTISSNATPNVDFGWVPFVLIVNKRVNLCPYPGIVPMYLPRGSPSLKRMSSRKFSFSILSTEKSYLLRLL